MNEKLYTIAFTLILTALCATAVSTLQTALAEQTRLNSQAAEQRVLLELAGVDVPGSASPQDIDKIFTASVTSIDVKNAEGTYTYYQAATNAGTRIVFPMVGQGYWDMVRGFMSLDGDAKTILGIRFVQHNETPGLGARIEEKWFTDQFVGKSLATPSPTGDFIHLVSPGKPKGPTDVDAVTGATGTSRKVERLINDSIQRFLSVYTPGKEAGQ